MFAIAKRNASSEASIRVVAIVSLVALLVSMAFLAVPAKQAWANTDGYDTHYRVNDFTSSLSEDEEKELSNLAKAEVSTLQFDFVVYITDKDSNLKSLAKDFYNHNGFGYGEDDDGIILCLKPSGEAGIYTAGLGTIVFSDKDVTNLEKKAAKKVKKSCYKAVYNFLSASIRKAAAYQGVDVSERWPDPNSGESTATEGEDDVISEGHTTAELDWYPKDPSKFEDFHNEDAPRVVDNADLLTDEEEAELAAHINDMRDRLGIDFVFYSDISSYGLSRGLYAADFYQFNGYGIGDDYSGVIYFVCMESGNRGFWTAARGGARELLTEANVNKMDDATYDYFVDGEYGTAVATQFDNLDTLYTQGEIPEDYSYLFGALYFAIIIALVLGVIFGIRNLRLDVKAMKTIYSAQSASMYLADTVHFTTKTDKVINHTITRKPHYEPSDSGGGGSSSGGGSSYSGSYHSSGGGSFSGGGRSF